MTRAIVEIAKPLGIAVHDHIIVGKAGHHASLKELKLIQTGEARFGGRADDIDTACEFPALDPIRKIAGVRCSAVH